MSLKKHLFLSLLISTSTFAGMEKTTDEDVLSKVSHKLNQIEGHLNNRKLQLSNAQFNWAEFDLFQKELMFVVAHDPGVGQKAQEIPDHLQPAHLSLRLKESWSKLEESVIGMGEVGKSSEWTDLKTDVEQFFTYREEFFYQPARNMIKSGELTKRLSALKQLATLRIQGAEGHKDISVRVIDPVIEGLASELNHLNRSVKQLKEFREPPKVEKKTIYHPELYKELGIFGGSIFIGGIFLTLSIVGLYRAFRKNTPEPRPVESNEGFDYSDWLKKFETHLRAFKNVEDRIVENHLEMKQISDELRSARKKLNLSDNQQDFYDSLDLLNHSSPKIEDYFDKVNLKKGTEASRKMVHAIVQLCQAIESGQSIRVTDQKKFKLIKSEQPSGSKAA